jgi:hypothetical protein
MLKVTDELGRNVPIYLAPREKTACELCQVHTKFPSMERIILIDEERIELAEERIKQYIAERPELGLKWEEYSQC